MGPGGSCPLKVGQRPLNNCSAPEPPGAEAQSFLNVFMENTTFNSKLGEKIGDDKNYYSNLVKK